MRILYVVHSFPPYENSGTPLVTRQFADFALALGFEVGVAFIAPSEPIPNTDPTGIRFFPIPPAVDVPWAFEAFSVRPALTDEVKALVAFNPDIVHIIDWVGLPSSVLGAVKALGVPVIRHVCNAEDICSLIAPIWFHPDGATCQSLTAESCGECLARKIPKEEEERVTREVAARGEDASAPAIHQRLKKYFGGLAEKKWQSTRSHVSEIYDEMIFPSTPFLTYFESMFGALEIPHRVIYHGIEPSAQSVPRAARRPEEPIRFMLVGWSWRKGRRVVEACFQRLLAEGERRVHLTVYGVSADEVTGPLVGRSEVSFHGRYQPRELGSILTSSDVGLVPSLFEVYNRTCREMLIHGVPVIGSDALGISDAVVDGVNGLLIGKPTADSLYRAVRSLLDSPLLLDRVTAGACATTIRTPSEEFAEILAVYRHHLGK